MFFLLGCLPTLDSRGAPGIGVDIEDPSGTSTGSEIGSGGDEDADPDPGELFDAGAGGGSTLPQVECDKVDVLFVIDSSRSMADEQENLVAAFPGFVDALRGDLETADSYHVGVISTDATQSDCGGGRLGVLATQGGTGDCGPYTSGRRFMTDEDDLATKFACAGLVGTNGSGDERPAEALIAALSSPNVDDGGCNEGFLRDDALLVAVIVTDEEDDHETEEGCGFAGHGSPGDPEDWFASVAAAKHGIQSNVVVVSLVGPEGPDACPLESECGDAKGAEPADRLIEFTELFTYGFVGPVCGDYPPLFEDAIGSIRTACETFTPTG